jgi:FkbM family methyltransferase
MVVFQNSILTVNKYIIPLLAKTKSPVVIDVGAHLGFFSLPLAKMLTGLNIYAIEPVSFTFDLLTRNTQDETSIKPFRLGLYDKVGRKRIYYNEKLLMYSSLFADRFTWDRAPRYETIPLTTLDDFCKQNNIRNIDLLKLDTEGAEERILRGGTKALSLTRYLFIECSLDKIDNSTFTTLMSRLVGDGYNFQLINISSTLQHRERLLLLNMLFENTYSKP